jgi:hypothetical protein
MKKTGIILSVLALVACLQLMFSCSDTDTPKFSRDTHGYEKDRISRHEPWIETPYFLEYIYVRNLPQDSLEQLKLMLWYADSITSGFQTPRKMKNKTENLKSYTVWFYQKKKTEGDTFFLLLLNKIFRDQRYLIGNVSLALLV